MPNSSDMAEIKVRLATALKAGLTAIARKRTTLHSTITLSDVARDAIAEYLAAQGYTSEKLNELKDSLAAPAPPPSKPTEPVTYRKASKKDTRRKIRDALKKRVDQVKASRPQPG